MEEIVKRKRKYGEKKAEQQLRRRKKLSDVYWMLEKGVGYHDIVSQISKKYGVKHGTVNCDIVEANRLRAIDFEREYELVASKHELRYEKLYKETRDDIEQGLKDLQVAEKEKDKKHLFSLLNGYIKELALILTQKEEFLGIHRKDVNLKVVNNTYNKETSEDPMESQFDFGLLEWDEMIELKDILEDARRDKSHIVPVYEVEEQEEEAEEQEEEKESPVKYFKIEKTPEEQAKTPEQVADKIQEAIKKQTEKTYKEQDKYREKNHDEY